MCTDTWSWFIFLPASILMSSEEKKGKNQTAEDNFFFSLTVYFSPVSLGLQRECWRLMMKMMAAAKRAERACDSWRESDGQTRVPQGKDSIVMHKMHLTKRARLTTEVWMHSSCGWKHLKGGNKWKQTFYVCRKSTVKASRCNLEKRLAQWNKLRNRCPLKGKLQSLAHKNTHTYRSDVHWLQPYLIALRACALARPDFTRECSQQQRIIVGIVSLGSHVKWRTAVSCCDLGFSAQTSSWDEKWSTIE